MTHYSKSDIEKVKSLDLLTYLKNYETNELVKVGRKTYSIKSHDSLKIDNGLWHWFSKRIGGKNALDFLMKVRGYSFKEAMDYLLPLTNGIDVKPLIRKEVKKEFILPKKDLNNDKIISYLKKRGIDEEIINYCIETDLIYQSKGNVIFVGFDSKKIAKYAMWRGTNSARSMQ